MPGPGSSHTVLNPKTPTPPPTGEATLNLGGSAGVVPPLLDDPSIHLTEQSRTAAADRMLHLLGRSNLPRMDEYELLGELGRGGMGVVYRARQKKLNRLVALKMLLHADTADLSDVVRFHSEAEAVAAVRHPHVVQVHEYGHHDGRPYLAMELLTGGNLHARLRARAPFPADEAAGLVEKLARAVHAAHQQGIIHRDLKPGNVLFDAAGEPRVTDFGLAKREACEITRTMAVMGTPAYMPPEQAAGRAKFAGPPADIYALGVILYECLSGKTPFQEEDSVGLMNRVIHDAPPTLRSKVPDTPRDLELICLKCLEKDPDDRYPTAAALADDLRHYLNREPVSVRPAGLLERAVKWVRRRPTLAAAYALALAVALLLVLSGGVGVLWWQAAKARDAADTHRRSIEQAGVELARKNEQVEQARAEEAEQRAAAEGARDELREQKGKVEQALAGETAAKRTAEDARGELERIRYFRNVAFAHKEVNDGNYLRALRLLDECPADRRGWEWWHTYRAAHPELGSGSCPGPIPLDAAFAPTWDGVLTGHATGHVTKFDFKTGLAPTAAVGKVEGSVYLSADGKRAVVGRDWKEGWEDAVAVWDLAEGKRLGVWAGAGPNTPRVMIAVSPTGGRVAFQYQGEPVRVFDVAAGKELPTVACEVPAFSRGQFSADGKVAVVPTADGALVWDTDSGTELRRLPPAHGKTVTVHLTPDGKTVGTGSDTGELTFHAGGRERAVSVRRAHVGPITALAFAPDGKTAATAGEDGTVRLWRVADGQMVREYFGHLKPVTGLNFSPKGEKVAACDAAGYFRVWAVANPMSAVSRWPVGDHMVTAFATDREITRLFAADGKGRGVTWVAKTNFEHPLLAPPGERFTAAAARDGDGQLAVGTDAGCVFVCADLTSTPKPLTPLAAAVRTLRYSADRKRLLAGCEGECAVWDAGTGEEVFRQKVLPTSRGFALSPDGRWVAYFTRHTLEVIDTRERKTYPLYHNDPPAAVDFTPDGKHLLVGTRGWAALLYDMDKVRAGGKELLPERRYIGHTAAVTAFALSPDGKRLATGGADGSIKVWDYESELEAIGLSVGRTKRVPILSLWFTDDGKGLVALPEDSPPVAFDGAKRRLAFQAPVGPTPRK